MRFKPESRELALENFRQRGLTGEFHVMDGERLAFGDGCFDAVYCHTVLHFTPDPRRMVEEIGRVLKPGGDAILMTVNRRSWLNALHRLLRVPIDHMDAPVFHQFTRSEFRRLLTPVFGEIEIVPERFPVQTRVHHGLKAAIFNTLFVDAFNALPRSWVRNTGHHLLAFARARS